MSHTTGLWDMLLAPARRVLFWFFKAVAVKGEVHGILAVDLLAKDEANSRIPLVADALDLIARSNPTLLRRAKRHLKTIAISDARTAYLARRGICVLNARRLDRRQTAETALSFAHEVTHAALEAAGFAYRGSTKARIERACVRAELRLARRFGDAELVKQTRKKFDLVWWEDEHLSSVREREWRERGLPEWLIQVRRHLKG